MEERQSERQESRMGRKMDGQDGMETAGPVNHGCVLLSLPVALS